MLYTDNCVHRRARMTRKKGTGHKEGLGDGSTGMYVNGNIDGRERYCLLDGK